MAVVTQLVLISASNEASSQTQDPYYDTENGSVGLPPVFSLDSFSVTVGAMLMPTGDDGDISGYSIVDVRLSSGDTDTFSYTDNGLTITIETGNVSPFDDYYQFLTLPDGELPNDLPSANLEIIDYDIVVEGGFTALIKWSEPNQTVLSRTHTFEVDVYNSSANTISTVTDSMNQNVYFDYRPMISIIKDLANTGIY